MTAPRLLLPLVIAAFLLAAGCGSSKRDLLVHPYDAGSDANTDAADEAPADAGDEADPTLGGPCVDDPQCDDHIPCTYDKCDQTLHRCRNTPDDSQCQDGVFCNGQERCVIGHGCEPGPPVTCDDGSACTIDHCVEATKSCAHDPRDLDVDGDPDDHCVTKHDCNDLDPTVSSLRKEVCANGKDDNCNGLVDEMPCVTPMGDTCATEITVPGPGTYMFSTAGDNKDYATSCSVTNPPAGHDMVVVATVPPGPNVDLDLWVTSSVEVAVAVQSICGNSSSELSCGSSPMATSVRTRARNVLPGTYFVIITTQSEASVELDVAFLTPTPKPTNENCSNPAPLTIGTPTTVEIIDPAKDLVSACAATTGELTYSFTLAQAQDVRIFSSTLRGSGEPVTGLRAPHCTDPTDELRCRVGPTPPLLARSLAPATYVVTVAATSPIDASVLVQIYPPTTAPPDESCATPPPLTINGTINVDLSNNEDAIKDGCLAGGPNAAFDLPITVASDVLLVARFPQNEGGAISFDDLTCSASGQLACSTDTTPARVGRRNVPPGDYRAVITDSYGEQDTLTALVRPTVVPTPVSGADVCANAVTIPATGGFFAGTTSGAGANFDNSCDSPNAQPGGAPDQVLSLTLSQPQRVVLDMEGSGYTTLLNVRQGPTCPGPEAPNACYVGFDKQKSFLDLELQPGQYWVVVDGYNGDKGQFDLDVRILPP